MAGAFYVLTVLMYKRVSSPFVLTLLLAGADR